MKILFILLMGAIGVATGWYTPKLAVYLHECGHRRAIRRESRTTPEFTSEVKIHIYLGNCLKSDGVTRLKGAARGFTTSNYLKFLSDNPTKYERQIRAIARAGIYNSILHWLPALVCLFIVAAHLVSTGSLLCIIPLILGGHCSAYLIRDCIGYVRSRETGDRRYVEEPEVLEYLSEPPSIPLVVWELTSK